MIILLSTLLKSHPLLKQREYLLLYSSCGNRKSGPKGLSKKLIADIDDMKRRNPTLGCSRIAQRINLAFGIPIDKEAVRRVLAAHCSRDTGDAGPSWLTILGHTKDSLWSADLFRCESILLKSHWVLVVMDQFTRRIIGIGVTAGLMDGVSLCCMFNQIITSNAIPQQLNSDYDPRFRYHQWQANLWILDLKEIKIIPNSA